MTREEQWLGAIAGMDGVTPPSMPVWHYEQMLAAIYDAVVGASPAREFPERSWHLDEFLWAVYCAVAGLADPGIPAPTCRIEEFWRGIYLKAMNDEDAAVPTPVWRIEEFLAEVFNNLTTAELKTVTGTMLHVLDALAKPAEELLVDLSPIQDLHGYANPWPAGGGKNKFEVVPFSVGEMNGITFTYNSDGSVTVNGTATARAYKYLRTYSAGWFPVGTTYTFRLAGVPSTASAAFLNFSYSDNGTTYAGTYGTLTYEGTKTITSAHQYNSVLLDIPAGQSFNNNKIYVNAEVGTTASTWTPYSNICPISGRTGLSVYVSPTTAQADATTYAIDWTTEAGTVYGGTLDVVSGVLTVDRAMVDLGTLTWGFSTTADNVKCYYSNGINTLIKPVASHNDTPDMISSKYQTFSWNSRLSVTNGISLLASGQLRIIDINYQSESALSDFTASLSGVQLCYELATPLTYQLTAQEVELLLGENYLWDSSGADLSLTYYADGNANTLDALNLMLGNRYVNNHTPDDVSDREALDILLGR